MKEDSVDEDEDQPLACDVCGNEVSTHHPAVDRWFLFSAGNAGNCSVYVCPDCGQSDEKLRKAFNIFVEELRRLPKDVVEVQS